MTDICRQVIEVARRHRRFNPEAYLFLFHALNFAQDELGYGAAAQRSSTQEGQAGPAPGSEGEEPPEAHVTGQQLCEAIRQLALRDFGYMAKAVFRSWGITRTDDFGEMVYHLIEAELMRKNDRDRQEDFNNVFDFEDGLSRKFRIDVESLDESATS